MTFRIHPPFKFNLADFSMSSIRMSFHKVASLQRPLLFHLARSLHVDHAANLYHFYFPAAGSGRAG